MSKVEWCKNILNYSEHKKTLEDFKVIMLDYISDLSNCSPDKFIKFRKVVVLEELQLLTSYYQIPREKV